MLLATQNNTEVEKDGIENTVKMSISLSDDVQNHIIKVLTETYKYPIKSIVRENFSNHWDSHYEAGKIEEPISVKLYSSNNGGYIFETQDVGLGMSEESFYKYYMGIGESTKRDKPKLIGGMGLGCKSSLSYSNNYEVITRFERIENKFLVFKGGDRPECSKIYTKDTTEPNGVTVKVPVNRYDFHNFQEAIKSQLCYFPTAFIDIDGDTFDYNSSRIFENDLFIWSEMFPNNEMHISFNNCVYPIDWELLGESKINIPIAIKIAINSGVTPQFNREALQYNTFTKNLIKEKIKQIANFFVEKYNSEWKEEENIITAWNKIGTTEKRVIIADKDFIINPLIKHSDVIIKELKIKDFTLETPNYWKNLVNLAEYHVLVEYDWKWKTKHIYSSIIAEMITKWKVIEVDETPTGRIKKYLLEKYGNRILFIKKNYTRKLGSKKQGLRETRDYLYLLNLTMKPKADWRKYIIEYQTLVEAPFKACIINEKGVENSSEYIKWLEEYKQELKDNRASGNTKTSGNYKGLNKDIETDVTIAYARDSIRGVSFEKKACKIANCKIQKKATIWGFQEDKEKLVKWYKILKDNYNVAIIGVNESKKIKEFKTFLTIKQMEDSKIFKTAVTAWLFNKEVEKFNELYGRQDLEIIENCLKEFKTDVDILKKYVNKWYRAVNQGDLEESMIKVAEENKLFDYTYWDSYKKVQSNLAKYDFINLLQKPQRWNKEEQEKYKTLITKLLYLKVRANEIDKFEINLVPKPEMEVVTASEELVEELQD